MRMLLIRRTNEDKPADPVEYPEEAREEPKSDPVMESIHERIESPPATWKAYESRSGGSMAIVEMEYRELMRANEEGSRADVEKELIDLAAACANALYETKAK